MAATTAFLALAGAALVNAHGHVRSVTVKGTGKSYPGYDFWEFPYASNQDEIVGWHHTVEDQGPVDTTSGYNTPDIICHTGATNAQASVEVAAGDTLSLQWTEWPAGHKGPILDYLAPCGEAGCEAVDKTSLEFFKIDQLGLEDNSMEQGMWATDEFMDAGSVWEVTIPPSVKAGNYVLRHEVFALHRGHLTNGAESYPQCINLKITGSGTATAQGVPANELYSTSDAGIAFDIYRMLDTYEIPGPQVASLTGGSSTGTVEADAEAEPAPTTPATSATAAATTAAAPVVETPVANQSGSPATVTVTVTTTAYPRPTGSRRW
jgi:cellulase